MHTGMFDAFNASNLDKRPLPLVIFTHQRVDIGQSRSAVFVKDQLIVK